MFVEPKESDAAATVKQSNGTWTLTASFGAVSITPATGVLALTDAAGATIVQGPLIISESQGVDFLNPRVCETTALNNTDKANGNRLAALEVKTQSDCCNGCAVNPKCEAWIYAPPPYNGKKPLYIYNIFSRREPRLIDWKNNAEAKMIDSPPQCPRALQVQAMLTTCTIWLHDAVLSRPAELLAHERRYTDKVV